MRGGKNQVLKPNKLVLYTLTSQLILNPVGITYRLSKYNSVYKEKNLIGKLQLKKHGLETS